MNSEPQKNGFKTFLVTIAVSLLIFSTLYFVITDSKTEDIEPTPTEVSSAQEEVMKEVEPPVEEPVTKPTPSVDSTDQIEETTPESEESVFGAYTENADEVNTTKETAAEAAQKAKLEEEDNKVAAVKTPVQKEEKSEEVLGTTTTETANAKKEEVKAEVKAVTPEPVVKAPEVLASSETVPVGGPQVAKVLGGADVEESTVPQTGSTKITIALLLSAVLLSIWGYVMSRNPNKMALEAFERKVSKDLD